MSSEQYFVRLIIASLIGPSIMISKEQLATLTEVLASVSVVGVGWALGGTIGAAVMAGIGINLTSDIVQKGSTHLKEKWISAKYGVLNHDIQRALARAFVKALASLEDRYFALPEANALPTEKKEAIRGLFKELKDKAPTVFAGSVEKIVSGQEVKEYLYGEPDIARARVWERVEGTKLLYTYYGEHFKEFLRDNINDELVRWFGEELKTDNRECNKAWRAFQRMLLEGIQADVQAVQANQEMIRQDLQVLDGIRTQLDELKNTIDRRVAGEPFQQGLEQSLQSMKALLEGVAGTTQRTEIMVDVVVATTGRTEAKLDTVVAALSPGLGLETPKLPADVQTLFDEGLSLRVQGKFGEARSAFEKARSVAEQHGHALSIAKAKYYEAAMLNEWDHEPDAARAIVLECLQEFRTEKSEIDVATGLFYLGTLEIPIGNLDQARAYLSESLELSKKHQRKILIASALHQLGWLEHERGNSKKALDQTEEALNLFLTVYQEGDAKSEKDAAHGVALCYHHKGLIHEHLGDSEEVESNLRRALEWNRKAGFKPEIAKVIWLLANVKFHEGHYEEGVGLLREAAIIYAELNDFVWLSRCLDLQGRLHYTLNETEEAAAAFALALVAAAKAGDHREQIAYLLKLGQLSLSENGVDEARKYFEEARNIALREELLDSYVGAIEHLARIAHRESNMDERNRLLRDGIQSLNKLLHKVEAEPRRAYITGRIGFLYEMLGDLQQSIIYYHKSKKEFEAISDVGGVAKNLASIARIKGFLGKRQEEFDTYCKAKQLLDGTPHYDMIADIAISLGKIQMRMGNLGEAKAMLQEADFWGRKYNLPNQSYREKLAWQLNRLIGMRKPPEKNLAQLIEELFELTDWFPEAKDSILRLWIGGRMEMLHGNFRSTTGVKLMIFEDDVGTFLQVVQSLRPYADLSLQVVTSEYQRTGIDMVPFPSDKEMFFDCAIPYGETLANGNVAIGFKSGGPESRYQMTSDVATSTETGNEGVVLMGWAVGLPEQAHKLLLSNSASELLKQNIFFLPYARYLITDKVANDLRAGKDIGLIPVYFGALPSSESVTALHSIEIRLLKLSEDDIQAHRRQIKKIKRALIQLLSVTKSSAIALLNALAAEAEELSDPTPNIQRIQMQVYILQFPSGLGTDLHLAVVIKDSTFPERLPA
jgi:tetratricopeptide (TPR) repeat protein